MLLACKTYFIYEGSERLENLTSHICRPAFVAFLQGFLPVLSSVQGSFNEASVGSFNPLEAAAVSGEVIGYEALVDCVHNQVRSNTCSAMVRIKHLFLFRRNRCCAYSAS